MKDYREKYSVVCCDDFSENDISNLPYGCFINAYTGAALNPKTVTIPTENYLWDVVCSFDIETSSVITDTGVAAGIMYHWQFLIHRTVVIGRTWEQFSIFMNKLKNILGLGTNCKLHVFVHNLGFEFQYLRTKLHMNYETIISRKRREVIKVNTDEGFVFLDTYSISNKSLEATVESIFGDDVSKLKLDYYKVRTPKTPLSIEEIDYCVMDVICVAEYVSFLLKEYGHVNKIPITMTGRARYSLRKHLKGNSKTYKSSEYRKFLNDKCSITSINEYDYLRNAMHGGFVFARRSDDVLENVKSWDVVSMYISAICSNKFPIGDPKFYDNVSLSELDKYANDDSHFVIVDVVLNDVISNYIDFCIMSRDHIFCSDELKASDLFCEHNRVIKAGSLRLICCLSDLLIYSEFYSIKSIDINCIMVYEADYLPKDFIKYVLKLYNAKKNLPDGAKRNEVKVELNSVGFGVHAEDPCRDTFGLSETKSWYSKEHDVESELKRYNTNPNRVSSYAWGVAITAFSRRELLGCVAQFEDLSDIIYSDTDCLKYVGDKNDHIFEEYNDYIDSVMLRSAYDMSIDSELFEGLGRFKFEGTYSRFKCLAPKQYIFEKDGEIVRHISGLPKSGAENVNFDNFNPYFTLTSDLAHKMCSVYIDKRVEMCIEDYQGNECFVCEDSSVFIWEDEFSFDGGVNDLSSSITEYLIRGKDDYEDWN